jgi:hypothetical protein
LPAVLPLVAAAREACSHSTVLDGWAIRLQVTELPPITLSIRTRLRNNLNTATNRVKLVATTIKAKDKEPTRVITAVSKLVQLNFNSHRMRTTVVIRSMRRRLDLHLARME